jgi:hypothetical protein
VQWQDFASACRLISAFETKARPPELAALFFAISWLIGKLICVITAGTD